MARTTEAEVRAIFSPSDDGTAASADAVDFWIHAANAYVTETFGALTATVDADTLRQIEALVACHGLASVDPTESSVTVGDTSQTFEGAAVEAPGLRETRFGRRAIWLDPTGTLAAEGGGGGAVVFQTFGT